MAKKKRNSAKSSKRRPKAPKVSVRAEKLRQAVLRRRYWGPSQAQFLETMALGSGGCHPCMAWFWGASAEALYALLPPVGTSPGFARYLEWDTYDALVRVQIAIEEALDETPVAPGPWVGDDPDKTGILAAANLFAFDLESDCEDPLFPGHHTTTRRGWLSTGVREPGSDAALGLGHLLGRVRNASTP